MTLTAELDALRESAGVVDRSDRGAVLVTGPDAAPFLQSIVSADLDTVGEGEGAHSLLLTPQGKLDVDFRLLRVGADAWLDVVGPPATVQAATERLAAAGVARCSREAYEALRIEVGIPRQGFELDEKTIPQEAFLDGDAVSFTKGCFLGQELVARIDTRGHVNKYLRRLTNIEEGRPPRGAEIASGDKVVGTVTSTVTDPEMPACALGYVRHEIDPPAEVDLRWEGGATRATVA